MKRARFSQRNPMLEAALRSASLAFLLLLITAPLAAQPSATPQIPYTSVPNFFKLPAGMYFGECAGVSLDSKGNIYVVNRGRHPIIEFHPDGTFMRTIGDGLDVFEAPHRVEIDPQDNIWYVDAGANLIVELDQQGRLLRVYGKKPEAWTWLTHVVEHGAGLPWMFNQPTDLAFGANGNIFVTDGYGNSRVAEFNADGNFVKDWGERGPAPGQFHTPHSIVMDSKGTLYVADRENRRVQVFDQDGHLLKIWHGMGAPWGLCITPGPKQVIYSADGFTGKFYKLDLNGDILGEFGKAGKKLGEFGWTHGIACPSENVVYAAEELNYRVQKLVLHPAQ